MTIRALFSPGGLDKIRHMLEVPTALLVRVQRFRKGKGLYKAVEEPIAWSKVGQMKHIFETIFCRILAKTQSMT